MIGPDHPLKDFAMELTGDQTADPKEFFTYYDAFAFWLFSKLKEMGGGKKILDIGSKKMLNAINSAGNDVTSIVLKDCEDGISNVKYIIQDAASPLPFADNYFDVFTSTASLHVMGLNRYGDKLNPNALMELVRELDRVMKRQSNLIISLPLGRNALRFNSHWIFDLPAIEKLFHPWVLNDHLVDHYPYDFEIAGFKKNYQSRYTKDTGTAKLKEGDFYIIFLHFKRGC